MKSLSHVRLFTTPWSAAYQAPPSMGFSRQEYWSGVPLPSSKILKDVFIIKLELIDSFAFLYTNYELQDTEIKKTIPFQIMTKRKNIYLGINLAKELKNLYIENCKTLVKETKDTSIWKDNSCS